MDQEIVELTNKLLDAKNTIDKLEELNVGVIPGCLNESVNLRRLFEQLCLSMCVACAKFESKVTLIRMMTRL